MNDYGDRLAPPEFASLPRLTTPYRPGADRPRVYPGQRIDPGDLVYYWRARRFVHVDDVDGDTGAAWVQVGAKVVEVDSSDLRQHCRHGRRHDEGCHPCAPVTA